jgi:hypothetical protein
MSLDSREQQRTRAELAENLALAQTSPDAIAGAIGLPQARVDAALAVTDARPEDVWLVRDYLEHIITSLGGTPLPYTKLREDMRAAAQTWFPLIAVDEAMKAAER